MPDERTDLAFEREHQRSRDALRAAGGEVRRSLAQLMAILVAGLGIFGLLLAWMRQ